MFILFVCTGSVVGSTVTAGWSVSAVGSTRAGKKPGTWYNVPRNFPRLGERILRYQGFQELEKK